MAQRIAAHAGSFGIDDTYERDETLPAHLTGVFNMKFVELAENMMRDVFNNKYDEDPGDLPNWVTRKVAPTDEREVLNYEDFRTEMAKAKKQKKDHDAGRRDVITLHVKPLRLKFVKEIAHRLIDQLHDPEAAKLNPTKEEKKRAMHKVVKNIGNFDALIKYVMATILSYQGLGVGRGQQAG